jgi:hypothetical protein
MLSISPFLPAPCLPPSRLSVPYSFREKIYKSDFNFCSPDHFKKMGRGRARNSQKNFFGHSSLQNLLSFTSNPRVSGRAFVSPFVFE